jgi:anti-sigma factor RsiW
MNHSTAWNLIPWFVNGRASEQERGALELHFERCTECCEEVEGQRQLMLAMQTTPAVESMPHASLQKLWQRIDADPAAGKPRPVQRQRQSRLVGLLAAAVAFEALLLGTLSTLLYQSRSGTTGEYRTVTSIAIPATPGAVAPGVRAVFSPALTLGELQALLADAGLRIASGPSEDGVYTLAPLDPRDDVRQALRVLRAHPAARFAEPIGP